MSQQTDTRAERGQKKAQQRASRLAQRDAAAGYAEHMRTLMANAKRPPQTPAHQAPFLRVCPKLRSHLDDPSFAASLDRIAQASATAIRKVEDWSPQGKSAQSLRRSLCAHLFARFPMPPFLWSLFAEEQLTYDALAPLVLDVARGGSLYSHIKEGRLSVPFTRKMCHDFMKSSSELSVVQAIRKVQVTAAGGGALLFQALAGTRWGLALLGADEERFFAQVVEWMARQSMLSLGEAGPMFDYLAFRFGQDPSYSMKARSPLALLEAMKEWHQDATLIRAGRNVAFPSFGVPGVVYDESTEGRKSIWRIRELLTPKDLIDEGRRMSHCVATYEHAIRSGTSSIWIVTHEDNEANWAKLTVEIRNASRTIVQARGRFNRAPEHTERQVLHRWASNHRVTLANYV